MMKDIKRIRKETKDQHIITKSEWMIAALSAIEKDIEVNNK